ncbi:zinc-binding dehydrogenase [Colletotrichum graminicola]|uniref:Zinc-binding dehydrogenase n=1 Tax=Colletotrichum graminicola (strain M1.001 / M2 / FGSC 10212) TaxID=645133 RepID=E3QPH3_COLGM|nr:zinc-binding dehydrogenase [Colletotrichum graminicola M1.001]EFQ32761.1 zinc-binding dehydrogenase [Colletotrichum graminicola M1.001]WDK18012.1 zinc-binding dehydrogenase [Colletotrichum graminicola]
MRAIQVLGSKTSPEIFLNQSLPKPAPQKSGILIQVTAAGVTGDEILWPELYETPSRIPGHELSGTISELGPEYRGSLVVGQEVFAFTAADRGQCHAEYAICSANEVAPKPASISHLEAAALPIPLLTAFEAILDHGKVRPGIRVLVRGASGAVGRIGVQLVARLVESHAIALASLKNHDAVRNLGADEVIDYASTSWESKVDAVDVVFDTVGGTVLKKSWQTVKEDGLIVTLGDPPPPWAFQDCRPDEASSRPNVRYKYFIVAPNAERLRQASEMIDAGSLRPFMVKSFGYEEAQNAWAYARQRCREKKAVICFL